MRIVHLPILTAIFVFLLLMAPIASAVNYFPATETQTTGTRTAGTFPGSIQASDDDRAVYTEGQTGAPTDYAPDIETITTGTSPSGTFPTDIETSNNVYVTYREEVTGSTIPSVLGGNADVQSGTNHNIYLPAGVASGDLLLVCFGGSASTGARSWGSVGSGWTAFVLAGSPMSDHTVWGVDDCRYTVASGGETVFAITTTNDVNSAQNSRRIIGYIAGQLEAEYACGNSINPNPPSITTSWDSSSGTLFVAAFRQISASVITLSAYPAGYTDSQLDGGGAQTGTRVKVASATKDGVGGTEDPGTFTTNSATAWCAFTFAIQGPLEHSAEIQYDWPGPLAGSPQTLEIEAYVANGAGITFSAQVWDGAVWNTRLALFYTSDSDVTQTYVLVGGELDDPRIRFIPAVNDDTMSDLVIDRVAIAAGSFVYGLEIRYDWSGASNEENIVYEVRVEAQSDSSHEVQVLTPPSTWNTRLTFDGVSDVSQTYTLTAAEHASGSVSIRFVETTEDETQDTFSVDFARVEGSGSQSLETGVSSLWILVFVIAMVSILGAAWWFKER